MSAETEIERDPEDPITAEDPEYTGQIVYIVSGESGSYDSRSSWNVRAFSTEEDADTWHKNCTDWVEANGLGSKSTKNFLSDMDQNPYDPYMAADGPVYYYIEKLEFDNPE